MSKQRYLTTILISLLSILVLFVAIDSEKTEAASVKITSISKLGQVKSGNVKIYKNINNLKSTVAARTTYTNKVYYVKKQAVVSGVTYYSINTTASTTSYIGWVRAADLQTYNHYSIDKKSKVFYLKGTGVAYSKPWGGKQDIVFSNLTSYKFTQLKVNLTEGVGSKSNLWYSGTLNGKTVWIHSSHVVSNFTKSDTSLLGQIKNNATILNNLATNAKMISSTDYLNRVFYIKQQSKFGSEIYYLISTQPSKTTGTIGWVKSTELTTYAHKNVDDKAKTFYLKGTGVAYSKPWGGTKDLVFSDLSSFKFAEIKVNLTNSVGSATNYWYRGTIDGKTVWIHSNHVVASIVKTDVNLLGKLNNNAIVYSALNASTETININDYLNTVLYIKQQAKLGNEIYYLLSTKPSKTDGLVGWVKSSDVSTYAHNSVDSKEKIFYLKGTGVAYSKPWGGTKDLVFSDLSSFKFAQMKVTLTESVGSTTNYWYQGTIDGKTVWIHSNHVVNSIVKEDVSLLGKLNNNAIVYNALSESAEKIEISDYLNTVLYIKQQAKLGDEIYYLLSTKPSKTDGLVGWVKSNDVSIYAHNSVDSKEKLFYLKGTGIAYTKPWGGTKDIVYGSLTNLKGAEFYVNLTESVGSKTNYWYQGTLEGQTVWIHNSHLLQSLSVNTTYNLTLQQALNLQMKAAPLTDKYRNEPGFVSSAYISSIYGEVSGTSANLRTQPKLTNNSYIALNVAKGTKLTILDGNVIGDSNNGSTKWLKVQYNNTTYYIHSSLVNIYGTTTADLNVRAAASTSSHIYGVIKKGSTVTITSLGDSWHTIKYNVMWRNASSDDVLYYLNPANFINNPIQKFQFLDLRSPSGVTAETLNTYLKGKGIFEGKGQAFIDAGKKYEINELYLVAHAMLETGNGTSVLANGSTKYNGVTIYNMYGIGAYDDCPLECGAKTAYDNGWTTPEKAIIEGAQFISKDYIYGENKQKIVQNTLYKMRWNPEAMDRLGAATHQYASDVGWASKQVITLYNLYNTLGIKNLKLDIPVYK